MQFILILGSNIPTITHFIHVQIKCYMLLTYYNYIGEQTNKQTPQ